jgi:hypothetical protein
VITTGERSSADTATVLAPVAGVGDEAMAGTAAGSAPTQTTSVSTPAREPPPGNSWR